MLAITGTSTIKAYERFGAIVRVQGTQSETQPALAALREKVGSVYHVLTLDPNRQTYVTGQTDIDTVSNYMGALSQQEQTPQGVAQRINAFLSGFRGFDLPPEAVNDLTEEDLRQTHLCLQNHKLRAVRGLGWLIGIINKWGILWGKNQASS